MTAMPRVDSSSIAFPDFKGATRWLVLANLVSFFGFLLVSLAFPAPVFRFMSSLTFYPVTFLHGSLWQPLTYSFIHPPDQVVAALFELISLWFLVGYLESIHGTNWVTSLYAVSVVGTAVAGLAIYACSGTLGYVLLPIPLYGCMGGIFGLIVAIGVLYGDVQFTLFPLPISIKAKFVALIYVLVALAFLYGEQRMTAFANLGGALAGVLWARLAPRRGISLRFGFALSESLYGMRNRYYRWKRRRAARKFEVYMKRQGRTVKFDGQGKLLDDDDPDDKKRWN
jgi:membrane associated rhomboid family serine protease